VSALVRDELVQHLSESSSHIPLLNVLNTSNETLETID
jgi:hypothetical protein